MATAVQNLLVKTNLDKANDLSKFELWGLQVNELDDQREAEEVQEDASFGRQTSVSDRVRGNISAMYSNMGNMGKMRSSFAMKSHLSHAASSHRKSSGFARIQKLHSIYGGTSRLNTNISRQASITSNLLRTKPSTSRHSFRARSKTQLNYGNSQVNLTVTQ